MVQLVLLQKKQSCSLEGFLSLNKKEYLSWGEGVGGLGVVRKREVQG
jgi:hypothetical protein